MPTGGSLRSPWWVRCMQGWRDAGGMIPPPSVHLCHAPASLFYHPHPHAVLPTAAGVACAAPFAKRQWRAAMVRRHGGPLPHHPQCNPPPFPLRGKGAGSDTGRARHLCLQRSASAGPTTPVDDCQPRACATAAAAARNGHLAAAELCRLLLRGQQRGGGGGGRARRGGGG
ncbi:hypothetical protein I4F81_012459 [Pyropia yezoensis]|uniref:Uncharacterized protein n=1 Tax=Pyropia yezoensis TaxID=2788 RepID=A0ACC3CIS2_PYRYE|nr:hypothetical protein I4F81_012459 [Neopyropia yezoensis]